MTTIQLTTAGDLARIRAVGVLEAAEIIDFVRAHYPLLGVPRMLWDLSAADVNSLSEADMGSIAAAVWKALPAKPNRKTAYIAPNPHGYSKLWRYINEAVKNRVGTEYSVFMDEESAVRWLRGR